MGQRHSEYDRADQDFYIEPGWAVHGLFACARQFLFNEVHDPCAGSGVVVDVAQECGYVATGADIADRANGRFTVRDFFRDFDTYSNIVCNPPYSQAAKLVAKSLDVNLRPSGKVAVLVPLTFLASAKRYKLFACGELDEVLVLSRRPSMPPGSVLAREGESCRHSGSIDFCWCIWQRARGHDPAGITWIPPRG